MAESAIASREDTPAEAPCQASRDRAGYIHRTLASSGWRQGHFGNRIPSSIHRATRAGRIPGRKDRAACVFALRLVTRVAAAPCRTLPIRAPMGKRKRPGPAPRAAFRRRGGGGFRSRLFSAAVVAGASSRWREPGRTLPADGGTPTGSNAASSPAAWRWRASDSPAEPAENPSSSAACSHWHARRRHSSAVSTPVPACRARAAWRRVPRPRIWPARREA